MAFHHPDWQLSGLHSSLACLEGSWCTVAQPLHRHTPYKSQFCCTYNTPLFQVVFIAPSNSIIIVGLSQPMSVGESQIPRTPMQ